MFPLWFYGMIGKSYLLRVRFVGIAIIAMFCLYSTLILYLIVEYFLILQINLLFSLLLLPPPIIGLVHLLHQFPTILLLSIPLSPFVLLYIFLVSKFRFLGGIVSISLSDQ